MKNSPELSNYRYYPMVSQMYILYEAALSTYDVTKISKILELMDILLAQYETSIAVDAAHWNQNDDDQNTLITLTTDLIESVLDRVRFLNQAATNSPSTNNFEPCSISSASFTPPHAPRVNYATSNWDGNVLVNDTRFTQPQDTHAFGIPLSVISNQNPTQPTTAEPLNTATASGFVTNEQIKEQTHEFSQPHSSNFRSEPQTSILTSSQSSASSQSIHSVQSRPSRTYMRSRTGRRQNYPPWVHSILKTWLIQNLEDPYPTDDIKDKLSSDTKLTIAQINNWFINARRRLLPGLLATRSVNK